MSWNTNERIDSVETNFIIICTFINTTQLIKDVETINFYMEMRKV